jgi:hypothetical protein
MRTLRLILLVPLAAACSNDVSTDTLGDPSSRVIPPNGAITGSLTYQGPRPCSANGHIVGNALILVFDRRNPPPPAGLATTAVNFAVVEGDRLFASEPAWTGSTPYCPQEHGFTDTITASAPFSVGPLAGASYILQAFYDYTGNFLPNFKFRQLPEKGDVGGGAIDIAAALQPINQNPNYLPSYTAVDVGIPEAGDAGGPIPNFRLPANGFVAQNVQVTLGKVFDTTRPYFYAQGMTYQGTPTTMKYPSQTLTVAQDSDKKYGGTPTGIPGALELKDGNADIVNNYAPILTIPQDIQTYAPPVDPVSSLQGGSNTFEQGGKSPASGITYSGLPHLRLVFGAGSGTPTATRSPFNMQILPFSTKDPLANGIQLWRGEFLTKDAKGNPIYQGQYIPEGFPVPFFWPLIVLSKLQSDETADPGFANDPANLLAQGDATHPVVIMQGITLWSATPDAANGSSNTNNDNLFQTASGVAAAILGPLGKAGGVTANINADGSPMIYGQDHITVMIRPAAICFNSLFDNNTSDKRGNVVTPYLYSESADYINFGATPAPKANTPVVPIDLLDNNDPSRFQASTLVKAPDPKHWAGAKAPPAIEGCLPTGRYAINVVYPDGQAWTVPNEAGACTGDATGEGGTEWNNANITCKIQQRPVVRSQGPRAVVEIVKTTNPNHCKADDSCVVKCGTDAACVSKCAVPAVPAICLPTQSQ